MTRFRLRLVSLVTLVCYLVTNAHVSVGLGATRSARQQAPPNVAEPVLEESQQESEPDADKENAKQPTRCKHCAEQQAKKAEQTSSNSPPEEKPSEPSPAPCQDSDDPCDDSCPCCPTAPGGKPCHIPGGCAYCSVAKIPCLAEMPLCHDADACFGEARSDLPVFYTPPSCGGLIRPPKS